MLFRALIIMFWAFGASASEWTRVKIPGAKCGDGRDYSIFVQEKSNKKMLIEFMGGGVCWDYKSCFKNGSLFPWLHPYPVIDSYSVVTANNSKINPFKEHSKIYFPYCTGDVHSGDHISFYEGKRIYHYGKRNIELAFEYLKNKSLVSFNTYNELVVYGASAGAIATLVHAQRAQDQFPNLTKKIMIPDSPGLHFGENFWKKFDNDMMKDFEQTFSNVNLDIDYNDGFVAKRMGPVLDTYSDWTIGFIYGLKDVVMSKGYGDTTPEEHKKLLLSPEGLPSIASTYPNVYFWLKDTEMHTFLLSRYTAAMKAENGETVDKFVERIYSKQ